MKISIETDELFPHYILRAAGNNPVELEQELVKRYVDACTEFFEARRLLQDALDAQGRSWG